MASTPEKHSNVVENSESETTPKRPLKRSSLSPLSPTSNSESSQSPGRSPKPKRARLFSTKTESDKKSIETKRFYKQNKEYINPIDRIALKKPKQKIPSVSQLKKNQMKSKKQGKTKPKDKTKNIKKPASSRKAKTVKVVAKKTSIKTFFNIKPNVIKKRNLTVMKSPNKNPKGSPKKVATPRKKTISSPKKMLPKKTTASPRKLSPKKMSVSPRKMSPKKTAASPRKLSPKKMSPKKTAASPRKVSPKKTPASPRKISPKKTASPRKMLPKKMSASPRKMSPKKTPASPRKVSPKKMPASPRKMTPKKTAASPRKLSPKKMTASPRKMTPKKTAASPRKLSPKKMPASPRKLSPKKMSALPRKLSPKKTLASPRKLSPKKTSASPRKMTPKKMPASPRKLSPKKMPASPKKKILSPKKASISPRKTMSPRKKTLSPKKILSSPRKKALSPKKTSASPGKKLTQKKNPISPRKLMDSPKKRFTAIKTPVKNATNAASSPRRSGRVIIPPSCSGCSGCNIESPKKKEPCTPTKSPGRTSPKKLLLSTPMKSPSKKTITRKFFKSGRPSKNKVESKKWVAELSIKMVKTKSKARKTGFKSKTVPTNRKRKAAVLEPPSITIPLKKVKILIETENIRQKETDERIIDISESLDENILPTTEVPLKESNSPRAEKIERISVTPSSVKSIPTTIDVPEPSPKEEESPINEHLLKENSIPEPIKESPKSLVKLFPIFTNNAKTPKTAKKNDGANSPISPTKQRLKMLKKFSSTDGAAKQTIIDAGQKEIGGKMCPTCNMMFTIGVLADEELHARYHNKFQQCLRFIGWKSEKVIGEFGDGRIIMISSEDSNFKLKKIEEISSFVDECLGFPSCSKADETAVYILYICKQKVVGCLIAQRIKLAYRVLPPKDDQPEMSYENMLCSTDAVPALCGVSRIWTAPKYRRKKIATRMLDSLRCNFVYGHYLAINDIAFSDPTPAGRSFAANYMKCNTFLVYK